MTYIKMIQVEIKYPQLEQLMFLNAQHLYHEN